MRKAVGSSPIFLLALAFSACNDTTSYVLTGLDSGRWDGGVVWDYGDCEYMTTVSLAPGSNVVNFTVPL